MSKRGSLILTVVLLTMLLSAFSFSGCGKKRLLSAEDPVTLTLWHVNGEQTESPLETLITEFNQTVGQEQGVIIRTTRITSALRIQNELLEARDHRPGAPDMPDLFTCHAVDAEAVGTDQLLNWREYVSAEEEQAFVPEFVEQGLTDGTLTVLPLAASAQVLFLNMSAFERFSAETGVTVSDLSTWDGLLKAADLYHDWSGGKRFCALDYLLFDAEMQELEQTGGDVNELYTEDGWINPDNEAFQKSFLSLAKSVGRGAIQESDPFGTQQMMTGEAISSIGSSAGILYYNDQVTYEDGTTEPLVLQAAPMPQVSGGKKRMRVPVLGIAAYRTTDKKAEAAAVFVRWLTEAGRNLTFAVDTGYMPVKEGAFDQIASFSFDDESTKSLYETLDEMHRDCEMMPDTHPAGYGQKASQFYEVLRRMQREQTADTNPERFAEDAWQAALSVK